MQILICYKTGAHREACHRPSTTCATPVTQLCIEQLAPSQKGTGSMLCEPLPNTWGGSFTYYRFSHRIRTILPVCFRMAAYQLKYTQEICTSIISHAVGACPHTSYDSSQAWENSTVLQLCRLNLNSYLSTIYLTWFASDNWKSVSRYQAKPCGLRTVETRKWFQMTNPTPPATCQVSAAVKDTCSINLLLHSH